MNHVEATGKTIEDAVRSGLVQLGLTRDEVTVEVLSEPKSGFLGIGSKPAVVRVTAKEEAEHVLQRQQEDVRKAEEAEKQAADAAGIAEAEPPCPEEPVSAPAESEINHPADGAKDSVAASPADEAADQKEDFTAEEAAAKAREFLQEVLKNMGMQVVIEKMIKPDKIILHLHGKNLGILIGKHGQTLDALQYLTNLTTNQGKETRHFIMLDVENYRHRREETLKQLALRLSGRVKKGDRVVLEPMNGYERKIIHVALQDADHVRTESEGQDPYRHVVIYYAE